MATSPTRKLPATVAAAAVLVLAVAAAALAGALVLLQTRPWIGFLLAAAALALGATLPHGLVRARPPARVATLVLSGILTVGGLAAAQLPVLGPVAAVVGATMAGLVALAPSARRWFGRAARR